MSQSIEIEPGAAAPRVDPGALPRAPEVDGEPAYARLPGLPGWSLWRWFVVRSSGFPAAGVSALREPDAAEAADRAIAAEAERLSCAAESIAPVDGALDALRARGEWNAGGGRRALLRARAALKAGRGPTRSPAAPELEPIVAAMAAAEQRERGAAAEYERAFEAGISHSREVLREIAHDERVCEAITWQNRAAFRTAVRPLRDRPPGPRNRRARNGEQLLTRYFQRYSVKNDTIGFFGPCAWGWVDDDGPPLSARCGEVVGERLLFFEQWAVDAIADTLAAQPALDPWLTPRRLPFAYLEGATLYPPDGPPLALSPGEATSLRACDGKRPAHCIADEVSRLQLDRFETPEAVLACLADLRARGLIVWRLEAPFTIRPERALRAAIDQVGDPRVRDTAIRTLDLVEAARDAVGSAAGDAEALDHALGVLDAVFQRLTGGATYRGRGSVYEGRGLVYEECLRDAEVRIGPGLLAELGPPLTLVLHSTRWFTCELARRYGEALDGVYRSVADGGRTTVPLAQLWPLLPDLFPVLAKDGPEESGLLGAVRSELERRWRAVLGLEDLEQREVRRSSAELRASVLEAFPPGRRGWQLARCTSVDLMIAAEGVEATAAGDFVLVLGEAHVANNTLSAAAFVQTHPLPDELRRYVELDLPGPVAVPVPSRRWPGMTSRTRAALPRERDYYVLGSHEFPGHPVDPSHQLAIAELVVEPRDGQLVVRTYDGRFESEIVEFFGELISTTIGHARIFSGLPHAPRVTVDRLVIQRESWSVPAAELEFAGAATDADRFRQARGWARAHGLPEAVFVTLPLEKKPIYVDFASPMLVEILARMIRRAQDANGGARVGFSELLPTLEQLWLTDPQDNRYTSELRMMVVHRD